MRTPLDAAVSFSACPAHARAPMRRVLAARRSCALAPLHRHSRASLARVIARACTFARVFARACTLARVCGRHHEDKVRHSSVSALARAHSTLRSHEDAEAYARWILDETHWGGEPEVSMLAGAMAHGERRHPRHTLATSAACLCAWLTCCCRGCCCVGAELYDVEIIVACCDSARMLHYGGGQRRHVAYMLYTGQHYDPLVGPPPTCDRIFPPSYAVPKEGSAREAAALRIAEAHNDDAARLAAARAMPAGSLLASPTPSLGINAAARSPAAWPPARGRAL